MEIGGVNPKKFGEIIVELMDDLTINFYAPNNMSIDTIDNILNAPTTTVTAGGQAYTLGNTMAQGSEVSITVNTASVIRLNVTNF
jgi:hypothetical protein